MRNAHFLDIQYTKRVNGTVLTPEMSVTVTTAQRTSTPFFNGVIVNPASFRGPTNMP
ncbi:MAG: hypothetical protein K2L00_00105 [Muribaculaceae bacterium]|nr:hypothetical protein [Muribaculaceae bacterium]